MLANALGEDVPLDTEPDGGHEHVSADKGCATCLLTFRVRMNAQKCDLRHPVRASLRSACSSVDEVRLGALSAQSKGRSIAVVVDAEITGKHLAVPPLHSACQRLSALISD